MVWYDEKEINILEDYLIAGKLKKTIVKTDNDIVVTIIS